MKARTIVTVIGGAALAASMWTLASAQGQAQTHRATLVLSMTGNTCGKTLVGNDPDANFKDRIRAKRNGNVRWTVINNCTAAATVQIGGWMRKADRGADRPFDPTNSASPEQCTAAVGEQCVITLKVRAAAGVTTYSYTVSINGRAVDPDLIIEGD